MSKISSPNFFLSNESFKNWVLGQNEEDCLYWDKWLKDNPEELPLAISAAKIISGFTNNSEDVSQEEVQVEWLKLKARIELNGQKPATKIVDLLNWWKYAAAAAFFIGSTFSYYYISQPSIESYSIGFSGKKTISLSDGTEIILNSNSQLTSKASWKFGIPREIWLEGEAYFKVKSHPESSDLKQFVVHTKDLDVRVVGTQFNVNTRKNSTRVYLDEGKVQLSLKELQKENSLVMKPGDLVGYSRKSAAPSVSKKKVQAESVSSWKSGYFTFDHTPLSEVIDVVESTHGIKITVSNQELLKETITGKIPNNDINELVKSMTRLFNLSYTMKGNELILHEK